MGSSVFHGGFSTFLAISVLTPSRTYLFLVFYRLWFGIILFGMSNGFLFLPVVLSMVGPTNTAVLDEENSEEEDKDVQISDELNQGIELYQESSQNLIYSAILGLDTARTNEKQEALKE